jgi:predicted metal-dependent HD superfamily phosphohydrolase
LSTDPKRDPPKEFSELLTLTPVSERAKTALAASMGAPFRHYHNMAHLAQLWRRHRRHAAAEGFDAPPVELLIACAIAYHDSVYDIGRHDNEERSAQMWLAASAGGPLTEHDRQWVAVTIRATKDHLGYLPKFDVERPPKDGGPVLRERARIWVLDLDLSTLGVGPEEFDRNTDSLRREAGQLSDEQWRAGQAKFLNRLLGAPRIYRTPTMFSLYEAEARRNIARLLTRLGP